MLLPTCCRGVGNLDQEVARDLVESTELVAQAVCRIEELPVDVELALAIRASPFCGALRRTAILDCWQSRSSSDATAA